jgi:hypothetical protein
VQVACLLDRSWATLRTLLVEAEPNARRASPPARRGAVFLRSRRQRHDPRAKPHTSILTRSRTRLCASWPALHNGRTAARRKNYASRAVTRQATYLARRRGHLACSFVKPVDKPCGERGGHAMIRCGFADGNVAPPLSGNRPENLWSKSFGAQRCHFRYGRHKPVPRYGRYVAPCPPQ